MTARNSSHMMKHAHAAPPDDQHEDCPLIGGGNAAVSSPPPGTTTHHTMDNDSLCDTFQSHWLQCLDIMQNTTLQPLSKANFSVHELDPLWKNWEAMEHLMSLSFNEEGLEKNIWNCIIWNQMLEIFLDWACTLLETAMSDKHSKEVILVRNCMNAGVTALWHLLGFCEKLISQTTLLKKIFPFQEILCPLLRLPRSCLLLPSAQYKLLQQRLVFFLYQFYICLTTTSLPEENDPFPLLNLVLTLVHTGASSLSTADTLPHPAVHTSELAVAAANSSGTFSSLPVPPCKNYLLAPLISALYCDDEILSRWARDSLILLLNVTPHVSALATFVAEESDFCAVLATGLGALFSELPRDLPLYDWPEDWCQLQPREWMAMPSLVNFLSSLDFCNYAVKVSHDIIVEQILEYIYSGFLQPIVGPSLHQNSSDELTACTAYIDLFLRRLHEPRLLRVFLRYLMCEEYDGTPVLSTLIGRINANSHLCLVTLCLFRTLLNLRSEDVAYWLLLRHLQAPNQLFPSVFLQRSYSVGFLFEQFSAAAQSFASLNGWWENAKRGSESGGGSLLEANQTEQAYCTDLWRLHSLIVQSVEQDWPDRYKDYLSVVPHSSPYESPFRLWLEKLHKLNVEAMEQEFNQSQFPDEEEEEEEEDYQNDEDSHYSKPHSSGGGDQYDDSGAELRPMTDQITDTMRESVASLYRINYFDAEEDEERSLTSNHSEQTDTPREAPTAEQIPQQKEPQSEQEDAADTDSDLDDFLQFLDNECLQDAYFGHSHNSSVEESLATIWHTNIISEEDEAELLQGRHQRKDELSWASSRSDMDDNNSQQFSPRHLFLAQQMHGQIDWLLSVLHSPFILALLNKLRSFTRNNVFINILLTELLIHIVTYPHSLFHLPLLLFRSAQAHTVKSVSLHQSLRDIHRKISTYSAQLQHWPRYKQDARHYLQQRTQPSAPASVTTPHHVSSTSHPAAGTTALMSSSSSGPKPSLSGSSSLSSLHLTADCGTSSSVSGPLLSINTRSDEVVVIKTKESSTTVKPPPSTSALSFGSRLKNIFQRRPSSSGSQPSSSMERPSTHNPSTWVLLDNDYRFNIDKSDLHVMMRVNLGSTSSLASIDLDRYSYESQSVRNYAYAAVLLEEFTQELACVCRMHADVLRDSQSDATDLLSYASDHC